MWSGKLKFCSGVNYCLWILRNSGKLQYCFNNFNGKVYYFATKRSKNDACTRFTFVNVQTKLLSREHAVGTVFVVHFDLKQYLL